MELLLTVLVVLGGYVVAAWALGAAIYYLFVRKEDASGDLWLVMVLFAPVGLPVLGWGAITVWLEERDGGQEGEG